MELNEQLDRTFGVSIDRWYGAVAVPAFAENRTILWSREGGVAPVAGDTVSGVGLDPALEYTADGVTSLQGPVERLDGALVLRIPLAVGGAALVACARGVSVVVDDELRIMIPDWLAEKLGICEGSLVDVDNAHDKLTITTVATT